MKHLGAGLIIVGVAILLASLVAAGVAVRKDLVWQADETRPNCTVIDETFRDGCSPIPPEPQPIPAVSTQRPTLAPPPEPSDLTARVIHEHHPRGEAVTIQVKAEAAP